VVGTPGYQRAPKVGVLEPFKPDHRLLKADPKLPGVRVRELLEPLGCTAGKTVVDNYLREVRPLFAQPPQDGPSSCHLRVKCSSNTASAMLASSGERMPPWGVPVCVARLISASVRIPEAKNRPGQSQHALVGDPTGDPIHQGAVVDLVKARRDVRLEHPLVVSFG
jgi:hypothetical protein